MRGEGIYAEQMAKLFQLARKKSGIRESWPKLTTEHFRRRGKRSVESCSNLLLRERWPN